MTNPFSRRHPADSLISVFCFLGLIDSRRHSSQIREFCGSINESHTDGRNSENLRGKSVTSYTRDVLVLGGRSSAVDFPAKEKPKPPCNQVESYIPPQESFFLSMVPSYRIVVTDQG
ncbi:hypothetical protein BSKO_06818 [Bryopsis sp. KO-2023]|nr:hypothetical protein BSKO_06818 [Bryopsis sp. KO-2023]